MEFGALGHALAVVHIWREDQQMEDDPSLGFHLFEFQKMKEKKKESKLGCLGVCCQHSSLAGVPSGLGEFRL